MAAMMPRVMDALRLSGGLKAGTAFDMASVPVMAEHPPEKAAQHDPQERGPLHRASAGLRGTARMQVAGGPADDADDDQSAAQQDEQRRWGRRRSGPIRCTPRRLARATRMMTPTQTQHPVVERPPGNAAMMAATPEATLTATVMT